MSNDHDLTGAAIGAGRAVFKLGAAVVGKAGDAISAAAQAQSAYAQRTAVGGDERTRTGSTRVDAPRHAADVPPPGLSTPADLTLVEQALRAASDDQLITELARRLEATS